jgi:hypothetical protein
MDDNGRATEPKRSGALGLSAWLRFADRIEYAAISARLAVLDWICGPEPATAADRQREAEKDLLQRAFPAIDLDRKGPNR